MLSGIAKFYVLFDECSLCILQGESRTNLIQLSKRKETSENTPIIGASLSSVISVPGKVYARCLEKKCHEIIALTNLCHVYKDFTAGIRLECFIIAVFYISVAYTLYKLVLYSGS